MLILSSKKSNTRVKLNIALNADNLRNPVAFESLLSTIRRADKTVEQITFTGHVDISLLGDKLPLLLSAIPKHIQHLDVNTLLQSYPQSLPYRPAFKFLNAIPTHIINLIISRESLMQIFDAKQSIEIKPHVSAYEKALDSKLKQLKSIDISVTEYYEVTEPNRLKYLNAMIQDPNFVLLAHRNHITDEEYTDISRNAKTYKVFNGTKFFYEVVKQIQRVIKERPFLQIDSILDFLPLIKYQYYDPFFIKVVKFLWSLPFVIMGLVAYAIILSVLPSTWKNLGAIGYYFGKWAILNAPVGIKTAASAMYQFCKTKVKIYIFKKDPNVYAYPGQQNILQEVHALIAAQQFDMLAQYIRDLIPAIKKFEEEQCIEPEQDMYRSHEILMLRDILSNALDHNMKMQDVCTEIALMDSDMTLKMLETLSAKQINTFVTNLRTKDSEARSAENPEQGLDDKTGKYFHVSKELLLQIISYVHLNRSVAEDKELKAAVIENIKWLRTTSTLLNLELSEDHAEMFEEAVNDIDAIFVPAKKKEEPKQPIKERSSCMIFSCIYGNKDAEIDTALSTSATVTNNEVSKVSPSNGLQNNLI